MALTLNKKVLFFLDEYGTAGTGAFFFGGVIVLARDAGRMDKCFSDLLEANANEIHASHLDDGYLQGLLQRFWMGRPNDQLVLINQKVPPRGGEAPMQYAQAVVETVKIGLRRFQQDVLRRETIGNVEVVIDANHHNQHPAFEAAMTLARAQDGRFRAVNQVIRLDSAAARRLQLADIVAYSRKLVIARDMNATSLRDRFGIQMP